MAWRGLLSGGATLGCALAKPPEERFDARDGDARDGDAPRRDAGASQLSLSGWGAKMVPKPTGD
jgi:hypothetical protein